MHLQWVLCLGLLNGSPDKSGYRRFRIKSVSGRDDYAMIQEIVSRRYKRLLFDECGQSHDGNDDRNNDHNGDHNHNNDNNSNDGNNNNRNNNNRNNDHNNYTDDNTPFTLNDNSNDNVSGFPDLVLIDGGKGQLHAALKSIRDLGLDDLPCASLAKKNEEIYVEWQNDPIIISKTEQSLKILQHARDEAHRFGVSYNRLLQRKMMQDN